MSLNLETLKLERGKHEPNDGLCLIEAVSVYRDAAFTDHDPSVDALLAQYGRSLNDILPDAERQKLVPFIPRLVNTATDGKQDRRLYIFADGYIRYMLADVLIGSGLPEFETIGKELKGLAEIVDAETAKAAKQILAETRALALDLDLDRALALALALDRASDRASALALALDLDLDLALDLASALAAYHENLIAVFDRMIEAK